MSNEATPEQIRERQKLVTAHWGLVQSIARKVKRRVATARLDDLISDGLLGLTLAGQGFDASRGVTFGTYARKFVRGQMLAGIKREFRHTSRRASLEEVRTPEDDWGSDVAVEYLHDSRERSPDAQAADRDAVEFIAKGIGKRAKRQTDGSLKMVNVARNLGISRQSATVRLRKARKLLREIAESN